MRNVFVSYVFEDHAYRDQVVDWANRNLLGAVKMVHEQDDVRRHGAAAVTQHLRHIMREAAALLVLVGQDTHNRKWVDEEIRYCASAGKPIIWTRLPNTSGAPPPELRSKASAAFAPGALRDALVAALGSPQR